MLYNFYVMDAQLREDAGVFERQCADDEDALYQAARQWAGRQVEVWSDDRLVAKLPAQIRPARAAPPRSPEANRQPAGRRFGRNYG